ncbi:MAG: hypothetical protein WD768_11540 [Phycisphaeraceae bacterium]
MRFSWIFINTFALMSAFAVPSFAADADDAQAGFDALYGQKLREASATASREDDVALAKQMLATAETAGGAPKLKALLCDKAYELAARDPAGYDVAAGAMTMIAQAFPEKAGDARLKIIDLRQKQFARARGDEKNEVGATLIGLLVTHGDTALAQKKVDDAADDYRRALTVARLIRSPQTAALDAKIARVAHLKRVWARIDSLEGQLKGNAEDGKVADEIVKLYVVDLDDPMGAKLVLPGASDASLRTQVPLAMKPLGELAEGESLSLAQWYQEHAKSAGPPAKPGMLNRARAYLQRFLEQHEAEDVQRITANVRLQETSAMMAKLGIEPYPIGGQPGDSSDSATAAASGKVMDLIKLLDPTKHVLHGQWQIKDGTIAKTTREGGAMVRLPVLPKGDYELALQLTLTGAGGHVCIVLPVGEASVNFFAEFQGATLLAAVDGIEAYRKDNPTRSETGGLVQSQKHQIVIKVTTKKDMAQIIVERDGKELIKWEGEQKSLTTGRPKEYHLPEPRSLGFCAHHSVVQVDALQLKMVTGKAEMLK